MRMSVMIERFKQIFFFVVGGVIFFLVVSNLLQVKNFEESVRRSLNIRSHWDILTTGW